MRRCQSFYFSEQIERGEESPFLHYSCINLLSHYANACENHAYDPPALAIPKQVLNIFSSAKSLLFLRWHKELKVDSKCCIDGISSSPLHILLTEKCPTLALALLEEEKRLADQCVNFETALSVAARKKYSKVVERLPELGPRSDGFAGVDGTVLIAAIGGQLEADAHICSMLLIAGLTQSLNFSWSEQETPLHLTAASGSIDVVEMLLVAGADPNATGGLFCDALQAAATTGREEIVDLL